MRRVDSGIVASWSRRFAGAMANTRHAVERLPSERREKQESLIPIRVIKTNKVHKHDKLSSLLIAFDINSVRCACLIPKRWIARSALTACRSTQRSASVHGNRPGCVETIVFSYRRLLAVFQMSFPTIASSPVTLLLVHSKPRKRPVSLRLFE